MRDADRFANMAAAEGLRSRAAYKLSDIDRRFGRFLRRGARVVDLGSAPGGFASVAAAQLHLDASPDGPTWDRTGAFGYAAPDLRAPTPVRRTLGGRQPMRKFGELICVDVQDMEPIPGARFVRGDACDVETQATIRKLLHGSEADVVLSDMSPATTGDKGLNHDRIIALAEEAADVARTLLRNGGVFVCKIFNGAGEKDFRAMLRRDFLNVKAVKPLASRSTSPEMFYVATGYVPAHLQAREEGGEDASPGSLLQRVDAILDDHVQIHRRGGERFKAN